MFKKILEDDPTEKQFLYWKTLLEKFIIKSQIKEDEKLDILISLCGAETFPLIEEAENYIEAMLILERKFCKTSSAILARHQIRTTKQNIDSIETFWEKLNHLAKKCQTTALTKEQYRENLIIDAFISGLSSSQIRQRILETANNATTAAQIYGIAVTMDAAIKDAQTIKKNENGEIASMKYKQKQCSFCGNSWHDNLKNCPALNSKCESCKKTGHWAKVCKSKRFNNFTKNSAIVNDENIHEETNNNFNVIASTRNTSSRGYLDIKIANQKITALIDTGSDNTFIETSFLNQHGIFYDKILRNVTMANNSTFQITGELFADIEIGENIYKNTKIFTTESLVAKMIIGKDILSKHSAVTLQFGGKLSETTLCLSISQLKITPLELLPGIDIQKIKPIATRSRINLRNKDFIHNQIQSLLDKDVIQHSRSPWRAQCFVINQEKKPRLVIDFSETINKYALLDAYPMPSIDSIISKIAQYKFFSTIDMKSAYHQVPLKPEDYSLTAFEAEGKLYEFKRLPFGCTNAVPIFQRTMDEFILNNHLEGTISYLDDIIIGGNSKEEHDQRLNQFLNCAKEFDMEFNKEKSSFCQTKINFLGHTIENQQIKPDDSRYKNLLDFPTPTTLVQLNRLIGLFAYYSKWIPNCSSLTQSLTNAREIIKTTGTLPENAQESIQKLKQQLAEVTLAAPNYQNPFTIETDASDTALGATLSQNGRPVAFMSRSLSKEEQKQAIIEREAAAIIEAVRRWRHMLAAAPNFTIFTDQKAISFLFAKSHPSRIKSDKLARWKLELTDYKFNIAYKPGKLNIAADALSRCNAISQNSELSQIHRRLCHPGCTRMLHYCRSYNLPYTLEEIRKTIENCSVCKQVKPNFYAPKLKQLVNATRPWERLSMDFVGPLPSKNNNKYILTLIDEYSRFPFAFPCENMLAETVIEKLINLFSIFGTPSMIHSDRGTQFVSEKLKNFLSKNDIIKTRTSPHAPWANGQCERMNGTLQKSIKLEILESNLDKSDWESVLPRCLASNRSLLCRTTNETPHERMFNFKRHSVNGTEIPKFLQNTGQTILHKRHDTKKGDLTVEKVILNETISPYFARVEFENGRTDTVSTRNLAPYTINNTDDKIKSTETINQNTEEIQNETTEIQNMEETNPTDEDKIDQNEATIDKIQIPNCSSAKPI